MKGCILETSLEKFGKLCRKALTLSLKRMLIIITIFLQKYALLTLSLDVICDVIYYLHDIAVKLAMSK